MKVTKKKLLNIGVGIILSAIFYSCLYTDDMVQSLDEEMAILGTYLRDQESKGYDVDTTDLGVYYIVLKEGTGDYYPQTGDSCTVSHNGYLMNGLRFDTSKFNENDSTWTFKLGNPDIISGWNDGMKVINEGSIVRLLIPSTLAYGPDGFNAVPPNNTVRYDVEMIEIKQQ